MTSTGSPSSCARASAAVGSATASTRSKYGRARSASSSADSARSFDDTVATRVSASAAELRQHPVDVLVSQDRRDDRPHGRQPGRDVAHRLRGVGTVPDFRAAALESPRDGHVHGFHIAAEECPCGGRGERQVPVRLDDDPRCAALAGPRFPLGLAEA